jgi:hypothetical protein
MIPDVVAAIYQARHLNFIRNIIPVIDAGVSTVLRLTRPYFSEELLSLSAVRFKAKGRGVMLRYIA